MNKFNDDNHDDNDDDRTSKPRSWLEKLSAVIGREPQNRDELMEILRDARDHGILNAEMLIMIEKILHVSETRVSEVMVPKSKMVVIKKDSTLQQILPIIIESAHSRFPVMDKKNVLGILLAKDIVKYFFNKKPEEFKLADIMRPVIFVPQSQRLNIMLREFRVTRNHIAIVLDEYGNTLGLVTIEDVLEQIVGEIEDEHDVE